MDHEMGIRISLPKTHSRANAEMPISAGILQMLFAE